MNVNKGIFLSLKQNIDMVKEELNSEEKFFEKAVITERFVKKYKNLMIAAVVIIVVLVGANIVYEKNKQSTLESANEALLLLQSNPLDVDARSNLESLNPELYTVWKYSQALVGEDITTLKSLESSKTALISDLASYGVASANKDIKTLNSYALKEGAIYKDLAIVQEAVLLMQDKKIEKAHEKLSQISIQSPLAQVAHVLMHYGVK